MAEKSLAILVIEEEDERQRAFGYSPSIEDYVVAGLAKGARLEQEKIASRVSLLLIGRVDKSKWPSYCRMCLRRDGRDPYDVAECPKAGSCEHYPFKGNYVPPRR